MIMVKVGKIERQQANVVVLEWAAAEKHFHDRHHSIKDAFHSLDNMPTYSIVRLDMEQVNLHKLQFQARHFTYPRAWRYGFAKT